MEELYEDIVAISKLKLESHVFKSNQEKTEIEFKKLRDLNADFDISLGNVQRSLKIS